MPNTVPASATGLPPAKRLEAYAKRPLREIVEELGDEAGRLKHLLDAIDEIVVDAMTFPWDNNLEARNQDLDRASSLTKIAKDLAAALSRKVAALPAGES
jgi:hypothetical protein